MNAFSHSIVAAILYISTSVFVIVSEASADLSRGFENVSLLHITCCGVQEGQTLTAPQSGGATSCTVLVAVWFLLLLSIQWV